MALQSISTGRFISHPYHHPILRTAHRRHLNLPSHLHELKLTNMHAKASVDGIVIAETDHFKYVEGNVYFPADSIVKNATTLTPTSHKTFCPWKGEGSYYNISVNGKTLENAAWYYPQALEKATHIKDHIAFCKHGF